MPFTARPVACSVMVILAGSVSCRKKATQPSRASAESGAKPRRPTEVRLGIVRNLVSVLSSIAAQATTNRASSVLGEIVIDELDQEHELPFAVLGDLEELLDRAEPGALREARGDLIARDAANRDDLDLSRRQRI